MSHEIPICANGGWYGEIDVLAQNSLMIYCECEDDVTARLHKNRCLYALTAQIYSDYEVISIEFRSTADVSARGADEFPRLALCIEWLATKREFAAASNAGTGLARRLMVQPARSPSTAPPALISISVVSHGDAAPLQDLVESVERHEQVRLLQLIVTDNLGADLPDLDAPDWNSGIMLRNGRPQGYAHNHNAAFRVAQGQFFCVLNPDVLFVESIFPTLIRSLEAARAGIAAPLVLDSSGRLQDSFRELPSPVGLARRRVRLPTHASPETLQQDILYPDWVAGIFMILRHETFARLNGFDTRYRLYFEDVDFCTRARLQGFPVIVNPRVHVQHDARRASHRSARYLLWHLQSILRFFTSSVYKQARRAGDELEGSSRSSSA